MLDNCLLLLSNEVLKLFQLGHQPIKLGKILLDAVWREFITFPRCWHETSQVRIGSNLIGYCDIGDDVHDLGRAGLDEQSGKPQIFHNNSINTSDVELQILHFWHAVDFDAVEGP
jgi:hypothetical protein